MNIPAETKGSEKPLISAGMSGYGSVWRVLTNPGIKNIIVCKL